jgi:DNA-binding Xre family transcriptional regulator
MPRLRLDFHWNLRKLMAAHDLWKTTELSPLLRDRGVDLSAAQVYRLVTDKPERLSMKVLVALCDIFDCTPDDLIVPFEVPARKPKVSAAKAIEAAEPEAAPKPKRTRVAESK